MKILFGIISCNENEYDQCINSAKSQRKIEFDIYEVKNKTKKISHDELYSFFMKSKDCYDFFVKLDGDMVLRSNYIIHNLCERLNYNREFKSIEVKVFDHFTKCNIWGLHVYRNSYRWDIGKENHFTDKIDSQNQLKLLIDDPSDPLVPAADHCPNPSAYQCFHFGIHKATKVIQYGRKPFNIRGARSHYINYCRIYKQFNSDPKNKCLKKAIQGFNWAVENNAKPEFANYSSPQPKEAFKKYTKLNRTYKITLPNILIKILKQKAIGLLRLI